MKIVTIIGARPQFIKAAVVSKAISKHSEIEEFIVHTGQHYDENMSNVFFKEMGIKEPSYNLQIGNLSHGAMTGRMIEGIEKVLQEVKPDYTIVYGDTNSTLAGAIATSKTSIKLVHIEAGLRSFNMRMPEEVNRIVTDRLSDILFCPTVIAENNLRTEGFGDFVTRFGNKVSIEVVGDVMRDAALHFAGIAANNGAHVSSLINNGPFVLCTLHRAENTDHEGRLTAIVKALNEISVKTPVILPLHPRTRQIFQRLNIQPSASVRILDPVGYLDMLTLIKGSEMILTDSGGLQKEAYFFQKPCLTLRDETEWVELIDNGYNKLVGAETDVIINEFKRFRDTAFNWNTDLYGRDVSEKIVQKLLTDHRAK